MDKEKYIQFGVTFRAFGTARQQLFCDSFCSFHHISGQKNGKNDNSLRAKKSLTFFECDARNGWGQETRAKSVWETRFK